MDGVIRHESEHGAWELLRARPAPPLRAYVRRYEGYRERGGAFAPRLEVPSRDVALILNFGPPFRVRGPGMAAEIAYDSFVAGLHAAPAFVAATGPSYCLQVDLTPLGARRLLGQSLDALADRTVPLDAIVGVAAERLVARLYDAPDWPARFALLDRLLLARLGATDAPDAQLVWIWAQLHTSGGQIAVGALADEVGWHPRTLIAQCRAGFGLPPKTLARVLRFDRVVRVLARADTPPDWVALARASGYYDQAHLHRDFRQFAGAPPGEFLRRMLPVGGGVLG